MSADTQQLERSALERKDRDELHTIAVALGGKPTSRARKADIVDLILELAGVPSARRPGPPQPAATAGADAPETSAAADPSTESDTDAARTPARRGRNRGRAAASQDAVAPIETDAVASGADESGDTDTADTAATGQAAPGADQTSDTGRASDRASQASDGAGQASDGAGQASDGAGQASDGAGQASDGAGQASDGGGQASEGNGQNQTQGASANQPAGDGESGNRRRRRRGRDRNDRERVQGGQGERADVDQPFQGEPVEVAGLLDLRDEGYGFLRLAGYLPSKDDVYISVKQVRQFALRKGDQVTGAARPAGRNEKNPAMLRIDAVNGVDPEVARQRPRFEDLTPLFPDDRLRLEVPSESHNMTTRIIDLVSPIGKGQRGLIVSPPKAGKTTVMKQIARSIEMNNPDVHLIVLLVDERPEEVTDMRRWVKGEVAASTFDRPADEHTMVAELTIERAKRLVEDGRDVVIILDGITRLARAYNLAAPATGRIMSGGIDTGALYPPKKFFGAARNIEEGGSLTILATALVETGSKMDEVIFEEFKGTGNMELRLDRHLAERRIYPAIDVDASSTRHEELLFTPKELQMVWKLRRVLSGLSERGSGAGLEMLIDRLASFKSNEQFLAEVGKAPANP